MSGILDKVKIIAFSSPHFEAGGPPVGMYLAQFNPEKFSVGQKIVYKKEVAPGKTGVGGKFDHIEPETVSFDFLIDGTGAGGRATEVMVEIELFKYVVGFNGMIHRPHFLVLQWGTFLMKCVLEAMTIRYELFRQDGTPLRAIISAKFFTYTAGLLETLLAGRSSPDLTHVRMVKEGDTLPLMAYRIYGDASRYLEVARFNRLNNFRNLKTGDRISFPPIKKSGA